jgi:hypothetical protein
MGCIALSIVSLTVSSCGNIFTAQVAEDTLSLGVNSLMATPHQWVYPLDDSTSMPSFTPVDDLTVVALYADGTMRNVPVYSIRNGINGDLADIDKAIPLSKGENPFQVSYGDKDAKFVLMVGSNTGNPDDPDNGGGNSGETTIEIPPPIWQ